MKAKWWIELLFLSVTGDLGMDCICMIKAMFSCVYVLNIDFLKSLAFCSSCAFSAKVLGLEVHKAKPAPFLGSVPRTKTLEPGFFSMDLVTRAFWL